MLCIHLLHMASVYIAQGFNCLPVNTATEVLGDYAN